MENKTKIVLTIIGLAAIVVPAVLLIVFSGRDTSGSSVAPEGGSRPLRPDAVQEEVDKSPERTTIASPVPTPSPSPKSSPTPPLEASGSGGVN